MAKYLILIYASEEAWDALSDEERDATYAQYQAFDDRYGAAILNSSELAPTSTATSIRGDGAGGLVLTDGAFVETKEALGGYFLVEASTLDAAIEMAKALPIFAGGLEVRPLVEQDA